MTAARQRGELAATRGFRSLTGCGVEAIVAGQAYAVGGPALLRERQLRVPPELVETVEGCITCALDDG